MKTSTSKTGISHPGKIRLVILLTLIGVGSGTVGFMYIEHMNPLEAIYMTIITLSTVGFREVQPLHAEGKVFVIGLIIFGVIMAGAIATIVGEHVLAGQFKYLVARRKMEAKLRKISGHYIIAGFGRVGRHVAAEFKAKNVPFCVIEKSESLSQKIQEDGYILLKGDATDDEVLQRAAIERAHTLISTLPEEALNVYLTLTARHMNPTLNIIARADFEEGEKKLIRAGANHVIIPHVLGGIRMAKAALQPNVVDCMHMASVGEEGFLVEELVVPDNSSLAGRSIAESDIKNKYGVSIIGVKQNNARMDINPSASTILNKDDIVVVIGHVEDLEQLNQDLVNK